MVYQRIFPDYEFRSKGTLLAGFVVAQTILWLGLIWGFRHTLRQ
jgi:hypothetical protein